MDNVPYRLSLWKDISINLYVLAMETDMKNAISGVTIVRIESDKDLSKQDDNGNRIFIGYNEESKIVSYRRVEESDINTTSLENVKIEKEFFDELEIAELSSNTSTYPGKAVEINLNRNINGMNTLSFSLPKYFYIGKEKNKNELLDTLFPQAKVKLRYKDKWYSFIITNREERRDGKIIYFDYSCTDMLIYELSKTGYELLFDEEHNGQGTIDTLAKRILYKNGEPEIFRDDQGNVTSVNWSDGEPRTEWTYLNHEEGEFIEKQDVYERDSSGNYVFDEITGKINIKEEEVEIAISEYDENLEKAVYRYKYGIPSKISNVSTLSSEKSYYIKKDSSYQKINFIEKSDNTYSFSVNNSIEKYTEQEVLSTVYEVTNWITQKNGKDIWGYSDIIAYTPQAAKNLLSNGENFIDTTNWESTSDYLSGASSRSDRASITTLVEGVWSDAETPLTYNLVVTPVNTTNDPWVYNTSLRSSRTTLEADTVYAIMIDFSKAAESVASTIDVAISSSTDLTTSSSYLNIGGLSTGKYLIFTLNSKADSPYFMLKPSIPTNVTDKTKYGIKINKVQLYRVIPKDLKEISVNEIASDLGLSENQRTKIISKTDFKENYIFPDDTDVITNAPVEEKIALYYYESGTSTKPIYFEAGKGSVIEKYTESGSEKIRTLVGEKSNYYNLLQTLAELFEGWIRFDIEYYDNGKIKRDPYGNQKKYIQFKEVIGKNQWAGFHYGVNISSISRTINSNEIATKVWVENSESKKTDTGLISIADSDLNEIGESFVYNFDYYIGIGSLDSVTFINDMFGTSSTHMSFSRRMGEKKEEYNKEYQNYSALNNTIESLKDSRISTILQIQSNIENAKINAEYVPTTWSYSGNSDKVSVTNGLIYKGDKYTLITSGTTYEALKDDTTRVGLGVPSDDQLYNYYKSARTFAAATNELYKSLEKINKQLGYYDDNNGEQSKGWLCDIDFETSTEVDEEDYIKRDGVPSPYLVKREESENKLEQITQQRSDLVKTFESKYRRYISEGTWSDSSYTDNNQYYLDAKRVAATSARPQISYTIDVLNLSSQKGYEIFDIDVGDKTFVCDEEFFGYDTINGERVLHRESFVVSEINDVLDNQTESTIVVQNFRTQFEDLFSRISATIQTVQTKDLIYSRGENFTANGEILVSVLQQTLLNNSLTIAQSVNNNVIIDNTGIEVIAINNTAKRLKIIADGIYVSTDGGKNWTSGLQADGMNAAFITTGQLNTNKVTITNDGIPSYNWDTLGITAYQTMSDDGKVLSLSKSGFVRFDQHGLYLLSTPTPQGASDLPIQISALTNGASYYLGNDGNKEAVVFEGTIQSTDLNSNPITKYVFVGKERYELTEEEVLTTIYDVVVTGASASDFGYDDEGNPWFSSGQMIGAGLDREITTPTWGDRLDYIEKKALVSLTWRGLAVNSKTGSVEIGTDLPAIRIYDNQGGQFSGENVARVDLGYSETKIGVPRRKDFGVINPTKEEYLYGLTLRNEDGETVLQTNAHGSLWLAENLFVGDTNPDDGMFGVAATSMIGIQGGASQYQGGTDEDLYTRYVFWSRGARSEQTNSNSYNFTIDADGHLTANSIAISGDSSFDGTIVARNGNILGVLGIGSSSIGSGNNIIYNSGFASQKSYSTVGMGNLVLDNLYYLQTDEGKIITVTYRGISTTETGENNYNFESDSEGIFTLSENDTNTRVFEIPAYPTGDEDYAIWVGRLDSQEGASQEREEGPIFSINHNGTLNSRDAHIQGEITASSGMITGTFSVGGNETNRIILNGSADIPFITNDVGTFEILGTGTINAGDLNLTDKAEIRGYLLIGDSFAIVNPPQTLENGDVYNNGAVILSGDYRTYTNDADSNDADNGKSYLKRYLDNERTGETDTEIKNLSNFVVTSKGEVIASNLNITGNNSRITGSLTIGDIPNRIVISESEGIYQESNLGYNIWHIDKNGKAIFGDITARGTIESSVLKYNEIQCSSGAILVRPASKVHKAEIIDDVVWIWLEDKDVFEYEIISDSIKVIVKGFLETDNIFAVQKGSSFISPVKIFAQDAGIETVDNEQVIYLKLKTDLPSDFINESIENDYYGNITFVSLGRENEGGLFLNSSFVDTTFGAPLALTIYVNESLEDANGVKTLIQNRKVVLGDLSSVPSTSFENIISSSDLSNLEGYGLYADNAFLKGTITTGQSGITTLLKEKNGIVLWAQANSNLNEVSFQQEGLSDKSEIIDYWRENDSSRYSQLPNFFVTDDGFLFAKQGYFAGTVNSDNAIISGSIGIGGLKISDKTGQLFITYDDPELEGKEAIAASFNSNGLQLFSGGDLEIYRKKVSVGEEFPPEGATPYIFSDDRMEGLVSQKILVSELPDSENIDYGVLLKEQEIRFVKRNINSELNESRSDRAKALGEERTEDTLEDSFQGINLAKFNINDSEVSEEINLSISIDSSENTALRIYNNNIISPEIKAQERIKTPEVNFNYGNLDTPGSSTIIRAVSGGIDLFVLE